MTERREWLKEAGRVQAQRFHWESTAHKSLPFIGKSRLKALIISTLSANRI